VIEVRQASGTPVFRSSVELSVEPGERRLVFDVPHLALLGGDYDIALGVHEAGDAAPGIDRLLSFSVASVEGAEGIADLRGSWSEVDAQVEVPR
jgi:hypothetical protein